MSNKIYLPTYLSVYLFVRSSIYFYKVQVNQTRYKLTKLGTSWLGGTSWPDNGYELTKNRN